MGWLKEYWPLWVAVAFICLMLGLALAGSATNRARFQTACDTAGGITVYDGRQYQCIKPEKP